MVSVSDSSIHLSPEYLMSHRWRDSVKRVTRPRVKRVIMLHVKRVMRPRVARVMGPQVERLMGLQARSADSARQRLLQASAHPDCPSAGVIVQKPAVID